MGFEENKHSTLSGSSSEESDHHQAKKLNENSVLGRFYECMYCKRGFTNAQALGGHMNIHRKEKAKAKKEKAAARQSSKSCEDLASSTTQRYYDEKCLLPDQQTQYYEVPVGGQMSYQHFFPGLNTSYDPCDFVAPRTENLGLFHDHGDLNLSMQIGHTHTDLGEIANTAWKESEVDLELRLGLAL